MRRTSSTAASSVERTRVVDACGLAQQGADLAAVVGGEVASAPGLAEVGGLADVEHLARVRRGTGTRPGERGSRVGEAQLGRLGVAGHGRAGRSRSSRPRTPKAAGPLEQEVQQVAGGEGVVEGAVGRVGGRGGSASASVPSRQLGTSSRTRRRARAHGVDERLASRGRSARSRAASRKPRSKRSCGRRSRRRRRTRAATGSTASIRGARHHHRLGDAGEDGDRGRDGPARVHERLERAEALAAAQLHGADLGDARRSAGAPPVVSRSTTQKVTSSRGVPRSSKLSAAGGTTIDGHCSRTGVRLSRICRLGAVR